MAKNPGQLVNKQKNVPRDIRDVILEENVDNSLDSQNKPVNALKEARIKRQFITNIGRRWF